MENFTVRNHVRTNFSKKKDSDLMGLCIANLK